MICAKVCWLLTLFAACIAAVIFLAMMTEAKSAPQQAAAAAMALAVAIIPYVFTRCVEGLCRPDVVKVELSSQERTRATPSEGEAPLWAG